MAIPGSFPFPQPAAQPPAAAPAAPATPGAPGVPGGQPPALSQLQQLLGGGQARGPFVAGSLLDGVRARRRATYGEIPGWSTPYQSGQQAARATEGFGAPPPGMTSTVGQQAQAPLSRFLGGGAATPPVVGANVPAVPQGGWLGFLSGLLGRG